MWKYWNKLPPTHCRNIKVGWKFILYEKDIPGVRIWSIDNIDVGNPYEVQCGWNTKHTVQYYDAVSGTGRGSFGPKYLGICSKCKYCINISGSIANKVVWL